MNRNKIKTKFEDAIGNIYNPKLILVGDKRNNNLKLPKEYDSYLQPFDFGNASKYLLDALTHAEIPFKNVMILNSNNQKILENIKAHLIFIEEATETPV